MLTIQRALDKVKIFSISTKGLIYINPTILLAILWRQKMFKGRLCLFVEKFTYDNKRIIVQMGHLKIECNIYLLVEILILTNPQQSYYFLSGKMQT